MSFLSEIMWENVIWIIIKAFICIATGSPCHKYARITGFRETFPNTWLSIHRNWIGFVLGHDINALV